MSEHTHGLFGRDPLRFVLSDGSGTGSSDENTEENAAERFHSYYFERLLTPDRQTDEN